MFSQKGAKGTLQPSCEGGSFVCPSVTRNLDEHKIPDILVKPKKQDQRLSDNAKECPSGLENVRDFISAWDGDSQARGDALSLRAYAWFFL